MTSPVDWSAAAASELAAGWIERLRADGGAFTMPLDAIEAIARDLAARLASEHLAFVAYEPGNGTSYALAFALLPPPVAVRWGGQLLVTLPEWSEGGRAVAFGLGHDVPPDAVGELLRLHPADAVCVAVLTTYISGALADSELLS